MNKTLPRVQESKAELKAHLRREQGSLKPRVQALYLLASGQATNRSAVARLVGVHRHTVERWLAQYAAGGLRALLTLGQAPGRQATLTTEQMERLRAGLATPEGFASYGAIRDWIEAELGVRMQYDAVRKLVRYRLGAKLKRARPSHIKKRSGPASLPGQLCGPVAAAPAPDAPTLQIVGHG